MFRRGVPNSSAICARVAHAVSPSKRSPRRPARERRARLRDYRRQFQLTGRNREDPRMKRRARSRQLPARKLHPGPRCASDPRWQVLPLASRRTAGLFRRVLGLRHFADFPEDNISPSDIVQPHHDFAAQAAQKPSLTTPHPLRESRQGDFRNLGPLPNSQRIQVLQLCRPTQACRTLIGHCTPPNRAHFPEPDWLGAEVARTVTGSTHTPHTTSNSDTSRQFYTLFGIFSGSLRRRRTHLLCEQRNDETNS